MIHKYKGIEPVIGRSVFIAENTSIIGKVAIGERGSIWFGTILRGDDNAIAIGEGTNIQDNSTVHVSKKWATVIGKRVTVGHNCIIHGCTIGDDCLIGMGSTVLDGAVIGKGSIIGANSLVTMNMEFPEFSLIMGAPAKVIRPLSEEEIQQNRELAADYIKLAESYMMD